MTATVIAYKDIHWYNERRIEQRLWEQTCKPFGAKFFYMDEIDKMPGGDLVVLDEKAEILLQDYVHPRDAVYIIGRSGQSVLGRFDNADEVRIDTPKNYCFFGSSAAAIVLFHRCEQWQSQ